MTSASAPARGWHPLPRIQSAQAWAAAVLFTVADAALLFARHERWIDFPVIAGSHIFIVALSGLLFWRQYQRREDIRLSGLLCLLLVAAGPLGAVLFLIVMVTLAFISPPPSVEAWFASIGESETIDPIRHTEERIAFGLDDTAEQDGLLPYGQILAFGSGFEKQKVLGSITRYFRPEFAPLLKAALADKDNAVRVMAATAMAAIEGRHSKEVMAGKARWNQSHLPEDALRYAATCVSYAQSGLLDKAAAQDYLDKAIHALEGVSPEDGNLLTPQQLAALYLHAGMPMKAKEVLEVQLAGPEPSTEAARLYMKALFELGEHELLRRVQPRFASPQELLS